MPSFHVTWSAAGLLVVVPVGDEVGLASWFTEHPAVAHPTVATHATRAAPRACHVLLSIDKPPDHTFSVRRLREPLLL